MFCFSFSKEEETKSDDFDKREVSKLIRDMFGVMFSSNLKKVGVLNVVKEKDDCALVGEREVGYVGTIGVSVQIIFGQH